MSTKNEIDYPKLMASMAELQTDMRSMKDGLILLRDDINKNNERIQDKLDESTLNVSLVKDKISDLNMRTTEIDARTGNYVTYKQMLTIVVTILGAVSIILGIIYTFLQINNERNDDYRQKSQSKRQTTSFTSKRRLSNEGLLIWDATNC